MHLLNNKDRVGSLLLLVFSFVYLRYALELPLDPTAANESFSARTLPVGLSVAAMLFASLELLLSIRRKNDQRISDAIEGFSWLPTFLLVLSMGLYSLLFDTLGFALSSYLFLQAGFLILGERRYGLSFIVAAALVFFLWLLLTQVFGIYLDAGELYRFLVGLTS